MNQVSTNGFTFMTLEPMLEGKQKNLTNTEKDLCSSTSHNGNLKNGLADKLLIYQKKLYLLGKYCIIARILHYYLSFGL